MKALFRQMLTGALANSASSRLLRPLWRGRASIFMLHRTTSFPEVPADRMSGLIGSSVKALRSAGANLTSLRNLFEMAVRGITPPPGSVAFTVDDGYWDQATIATAFLRNDCPVTIFLVSGFMDGKLWPWDEKLAHVLTATTRSALEVPSLRQRYPLATREQKHHAIHQLQNACKTLSWHEADKVLHEIWAQAGIDPGDSPPPLHRPIGWSDARALERDGVDFAPHSVTHRITSRLSDDEASHEIVHSVERLNAELVRPTAVYAWPTGRAQDFTERDVLLARKHGMLGAVSAETGYADFRSAIKSPNELFSIRRFAFASEPGVNVQYGTSIEELKNRVRGYSF